MRFLQLGAIPPLWYPQVDCCAPYSFPRPLAKKRGCVFAEPLFGISMAGDEGLWLHLAGRGARLCPGTTGSLNALRAAPCPAGSGRARPLPGAFGPSLHGDGVFCSGGGQPLHPPAAWQGGMAERGAQGGQTGGQEEMTLLGVELEHRIIGKRPPPIAEVSPTRWPSILAGGWQRAE